MPITIEGTPFRYIRSKPHHVGQPSVTAKLGNVDAARDADRNAHQAGDRQQNSRSQNGVGHTAAGLTHRLGYLG